MCALFAPVGAREALFALLAFNDEIARIRESVREPLLGEIRLQWWRDALDGIFAGTPPRQEVAMALAAAIARHALPRAPFDRLLDARGRDLYDEEPETRADLLAYVDATAGTLAELELRVLGADDGASRAAARAVAAAFALAGLLRALPHHARAGRLYLPKDAMDRAGLGRRAVLELKRGPALELVCREIAGEARKSLAAGRDLRGRVARGALPVLLAGVLAGIHLDRLARAGHDPFAPELARAGRPGRLRLILAAWRGRY